MRELLIGCGSRRDRLLRTNGHDSFSELVTLDINADHKPDILWDLEKLPYPFKNNEFDEIHAYEVLEHLGDQGDYKAFFAQFSEIWRILKPDGMLCATCPSAKSNWAWGDPSHRRIVSPESLTFLSQKAYEEQVGKTAMSDFRYIYQADFEPVYINDDGQTFSFVMKAIKEQVCH